MSQSTASDGWERIAYEHVQRTGDPGSTQLPPGLSLRCCLYSEHDARHISHAVCPAHDRRTFACLNDQVRIALSCVKRGEPVAVSEAHTASDGIMNHKLVLIARTQGDKLRQQISKLSNFGKPDVARTVPVVRFWSDQLVSYR